MSFLYTPEKVLTLCFNFVLLGFIQMNLYEPAAIQFHGNSLAPNFTWENQLLQDHIVQGCQSAAPGMFSLIF